MADPKLPKNISAWRLTKAETEELKDRVDQARMAAAELVEEFDSDAETTKIKREIQKRKALASQEKKRGSQAEAVAQIATAGAAKAKAKSKGKAAKPGPGSKAEAAESGPNTDYFVRLREDKALILSEMGESFEQASPLPIKTAADNHVDGAGGVQDIYDPVKGAAAIQNHSVYRCSVSLWWVQTFTSPIAGVPLNRTRIEQMVEFYFPGFRPQFMTKRMVELLVTGSASLVANPKPMEFEQVSPEELTHSLLVGFAGAIRNKRFFEPAEWQEMRDKWAAVFLSIPAAFVTLPSDVSTSWALSFNQRQSVMQDHESMSRTGLQQTMEIMAFKGLLEAQSGDGKSLKASEILEGLKKAGLKAVKQGANAGAEDDSGLSVNLINNAMSVHQKLLGQSRIVELVLMCEDEYGSKAFTHKLSNLAMIATKCSTPAMRLWVMEGLVDSVFHGVVTNDAYTKHTLSGDKTHAGWVSLLELKQEAGNCAVRYHTYTDRSHALDPGPFHTCKLNNIRPRACCCIAFACGAPLGPWP